MPQKLLKQAFSVGLKPAPTKTVTDADGNTVTLHALPILPASPFRPVDSRAGIEFSYDADALIADYERRGRRIVLDVDHLTEGYGVDSRARGWSVALTTAARERDAGLEDGPLYGWFELTDLGVEALSKKHYGYTSGVALGRWLDETHFVFTRIKSLALTNNPATEMPQAFTADNSDDDSDLQAGAPYTTQQTADKEAEMLAKILDQLGLAADADEAAVLDAITALTAAKTKADEAAAAFAAAGVDDVTAFAAKSGETSQALSAAQAEVAALKVELQAFKAAAADQAAVAAVDAAIAACKITPAQREAMLKFARADVAAFTAAMEAAPAVLSADKTAQAPAAGSQDVALTDAVKEYLTKVVGVSEDVYVAGASE
ncbi:hypothetical protein IS481_14780 [Caldimonas thermodepolymerans]|uniref:Uncharacterized protein n=1 Tax=Caldimonas thermodepolymerans TaxID=215580 RepID=A0A2S5T3J8_9BURK|nr:phage protease [Caldimonas thermodepolymerans]PPE69499.1 hypothetical protein C1702_11185 [Caldimonas thermodepolymerans]QPC30987.1 hypothetical protein IS481_14780 [Caldimonas thermodepolymerans]RDH96999.1 phage I-like protein [Caldimonas thermodepolymerans]